MHGQRDSGLKTSFAYCLFTFAPREGKKVAHKLAQLAHSEPNKFWMDEVPYSIIEVYFHDLIH